MLDFETCSRCKREINGEIETKPIVVDNPENAEFERMYGISLPPIEIDFIGSCRVGEWRQGFTHCPPALVDAYLERRGSDIIKRIAASGCLRPDEIEFLQELVYVGTQKLPINLKQSIYYDPPIWCDRYKGDARG